MNSRNILVVSLALTLTGCAHYEQIAADRCAAAGYDRGSNEHARCTADKVASKRRQDAINQERAAAVLMAVGFGMMAASAPPPPQPAPSQDHVCIAPNN